MTGHPIPAPRSWSQQTGAEMMDDMGEHAVRVGRLDREDMDRRMLEKRLHVAAVIADSNGTYSVPTEAASAVSGIGFENEPAPKRRLGPLTSIERRLLRREPTYTWAVVVVGSILCAIRLLWGAS